MRSTPHPPNILLIAPEHCRRDPYHPLLTLPEAIVTDSFGWTKNPQRLQEYRNRLAEAVENSKKDKESQ